MSEIVLDKYQKQALDRIISGENVFITGVAGTGKSTLLMEIKEALRRKKRKFAVTAPTGRAAINVEGSTIHSFFGIGEGKFPAEVLLKNMFQGSKNKIKGVDVLIVDEISMLSKDLIEKLEYISRDLRKGKHFFGGMQLVFFGDFFQLPPVAIKKIPEYAFESNVWNQAMLTPIELKKVYRQKNQKFVDILAEVRLGKVSEEAENILKKCVFSKEKVPEGIVPIVLLATNNEVNGRNSEKMKALKTEEFSYNIQFGGDQKAAKKLAKQGNIPDKVVLKKGAQVMLTANAFPELPIANGSIGTITEFDDGGNPIVLFSNGVKQQILPYIWKRFNYHHITLEQQVIARVSQVPLKLAWAITTHKSQGCQFDHVYIDFFNFFAEGQAYVAISRAKSFDGLFLANFDKVVAKASSKVMNFYNNL